MTTEEPVFSTAFVMKDFLEYELMSLILGLFNGWDITFDEQVIKIEIAEQSNIFLWL